VLESKLSASAESGNVSLESADIDNSSYEKISTPGKNTATARKHLEIFGRVVDENRQPVDHVLVFVELHNHSTRTDPDGQYRFSLEMPTSRFPSLQFLRSGFEARRIKISAADLNQDAEIEMDVTLQSTLDSVTLNGWVGTDTGASLKGVKIALGIGARSGMTINPLTVLSDETGNFSFEGIKPGAEYGLRAMATSAYSIFEDEDFAVTQNPARLNIVLDSLNLIDIDGMIVNTENTPLPDFEIYIHNTSTEIHVQKIVSDSSGFFRLRNFPVGEVSLSTRGADYFTITGMTLPGDKYSSLKLIVDQGTHYLSGWVSDINGNAVAQAMVTLDAKSRDGPIEYFSFRTKGTDNAGNFYFDRVGNGEHQITVFASGFKREEIIHRFNGQTDQIHIILTR
jgi:protocatechuate 3,4-dioxygenase beta subunit